MGILNLPSHGQVNPRLHALLFCWCQQASLPTEHGHPAFPTMSSNGKTPAALSKSRTKIFYWVAIHYTAGRPPTVHSPSTPHCAWQQDSPLFPVVGDIRRLDSPNCTETQYFLSWLPAGETCLFCLRELLHRAVFRFSVGTKRPASQSAQRPSALHCDWEIPCSPFKEWKP
jgi:hypothetical protein